MSDGYSNRQALIPAEIYAKRFRTAYEMPPAGIPSVHETCSYSIRDDDRGGPQMTKDPKAIGSAYDRYLQNRLSVLSAGEAACGVSAVGGLSGHLAPDHSLLNRYGVVSDPVDVVANKPARGTLPLPPDASNTIYVEALPSDCTKREVARILIIYPRLCLCHIYYSFRPLFLLCIFLIFLDIFRPFVGYKEVRLVTKDCRHRSGDPHILCFVDFDDAACAATALSALQGYKMDENDSKSRCLRLEFSRHPGPRSSSRGR